MAVMSWQPKTWKPPTEWALLQQGIGCPLCADLHSEENPFSYRVKELRQSVVQFSKNQHMRGWTVVIFKRHANELFELTPVELGEFWQDVAEVAKALYVMYQPAKLNYCIFGHHIPHVHCHLIPHYFGEDANKPVNMNKQEVFLTADEYQARIQTLQGLLGDQRIEIGD